MGLWRDLPRETRAQRIAAGRRRMKEFAPGSGPGASLTTAGWRDLAAAVDAPVDALRRALDPAWAERRCARINAARGHARRTRPAAPAINPAADRDTIQRLVPNRDALGSNGRAWIAVTLPRLRCLE